MTRLFGHSRRLWQHATTRHNGPDSPPTTVAPLTPSPYPHTDPIRPLLRQFHLFAHFSTHPLLRSFSTTSPLYVPPYHHCVTRSSVAPHPTSPPRSPPMPHHLHHVARRLRAPGGTVAVPARAAHLRAHRRHHRGMAPQTGPKPPPPPNHHPRDPQYPPQARRPQPPPPVPRSPLHTAPDRLHHFP